MTASIRGHCGQIKIFQDGALSDIANLTNVQIQQDSTFSRSNYVGNPVPEGDQSIEGWSGNFDAEVKDAAIDDFIDGLVTNNLAGIGVSDYTFISTENYADGTTRSYVYFDCQFKMSKTQGGLNAKMTKKLDFQAAGRLKL
jgi:hypothetical protein